MPVAHGRDKSPASRAAVRVGEVKILCVVMRDPKMQQACSLFAHQMSPVQSVLILEALLKRLMQPADERHLLRQVLLS